jgi:hypothetical protein
MSINVEDGHPTNIGRVLVHPVEKCSEFYYIYCILEAHKMVPKAKGGRLSCLYLSYVVNVMSEQFM